MLFERLRQIEERARGIETILADASAYARPDYGKLRKELSDTEEVLGRFSEYRVVLRQLAEARALAEGSDREMKELAEAEVVSLTSRESLLEEELKRLLLPK